MRNLTIIALLAFAGFVVPQVQAQTGDALSQYQNAVQIRMDDLIRGAAQEFFVNAQLEPAEISQVISTSKFNMDEAGVRIASLDLQVVMISDHPAEVVRQLRQFIGQMLHREGFVLDHLAGTEVGTPVLTMVIDVQKPTVPFSWYDIPRNWREFGVFGLIVAALLSSLCFGGYLLMLPFSRSRWKARILAERKEQLISMEPEINQMLPHLAGESAEHFPEIGLPALDLMLAKEKERQNFPVWLNGNGVRMANIEAIRKSFEVLPFDEALELLSCMDANDRTVILNRLNLNISVKDRIGKELAARILVPHA